MCVTSFKLICHLEYRTAMGEFCEFWHKDFRGDRGVLENGPNPYSILHIYCPVKTSS